MTESENLVFGWMIWMITKVFWGEKKLGYAGVITSLGALKKIRYTADICTWAAVGVYLRYVYNTCKIRNHKIFGFCY